tara:strand:+ start:323 stop:544 length:222 start_codon:yes stop_codon:yes gene_type:complete
VIPVDVCVQVVPTVPVQDEATVVVSVLSDFNVIAAADFILSVEPDLTDTMPDTVVKAIFVFALTFTSASEVTV